MRSAGENGKYGLILAIYLIGLLIGGLYVGMVSPVRTVVQADFGIDSTLGIWMINIYTLFYAALIPIIGKIADRRGRKRVFTICMGVFCAGSASSGTNISANGYAPCSTGCTVGIPAVWRQSARQSACRRTNGSWRSAAV